MLMLPFFILQGDNTVYYFWRRYVWPFLQRWTPWCWWYCCRSSYFVHRYLQDPAYSTGPIHTSSPHPYFTEPLCSWFTWCKVLCYLCMHCYSEIVMSWFQYLKTLKMYSTVLLCFLTRWWHWVSLDSLCMFTWWSSSGKRIVQGACIVRGGVYSMRGYHVHFPSFVSFQWVCLYFEVAYSLYTEDWWHNNNLP